LKENYLKNHLKTVVGQSSQVDDIKEKISEVGSILSQIEKNQKKIIEDSKSFFEELDNNSDYYDISKIEYQENLLEIEQEIFSIPKKEVITSIDKLEDISFTDDMSWEEYINATELYAKNNGIDLELEYEEMLAFENIELIQINKGADISIICIDGFLTQDCKNITDEWLENLPEEYKEYNIYYCKWESKKFLDIAKSQIIPTLTNLLTRIPYVIPSSIYELIKIWKIAGDNAVKAGKSLAGIIHNREENFILIGHSLGARVINSCLSNLSKEDRCNIRDVFLLGGAVRNDDNAWKNLPNIITGKVYNYFSKKDHILMILYKIGEGLDFNEPIGRNEINKLYVENINVSDSISGHTKYHCNLSKLFSIVNMN
jgi:hypothetical protein